MKNVSVRMLGALLAALLLLAGCAGDMARKIDGKVEWSDRTWTETGKTVATVDGTGGVAQICTISKTCHTEDGRVICDHMVVQGCQVATTTGGAIAGAGVPMVAGATILGYAEVHAAQISRDGAVAAAAAIRPTTVDVSQTGASANATGGSATGGSATGGSATGGAGGAGGAGGSGGVGGAGGSSGSSAPAVPSGSI